jgi:quercetin dioxygenase-like cupin family protein
MELPDGKRIKRLGPSTEDAYRVVWATIPPGGRAALHCHTDAASLYVLSEEAEALVQTTGGLEWQMLRPGDIIHIPTTGAQHARIQSLVEIFKRYGCWLGSREENAALGIEPA